MSGVPPGRAVSCCSPLRSAGPPGGWQVRRPRAQPQRICVRRAAQRMSLPRRAGAEPLYRGLSPGATRAVRTGASQGPSARRPPADSELLLLGDPLVRCRCAPVGGGSFHRRLVSGGGHSRALARGPFCIFQRRVLFKVIEFAVEVCKASEVSSLQPCLLRSLSRADVQNPS